jgi:hypothetical protein
MRLKKSKTAAEEELILLMNEGHRILRIIREDYGRKTENRTFTPTDSHQYRLGVRDWTKQAEQVINSIFPTELEANRFLQAFPPLHPDLTSHDIDGMVAYVEATKRLEKQLVVLGQLRDTDLARYTDLPLEARLYVENIDSFRNVKDVNPDLVAAYLADGSYLDISEEAIQIALEQIINESSHKKDWGGEENDLYTSNIEIQGQRVAAAFLLKGNGLKKRTMEIADCGKNGDQIVRLVQSPARLFVVQFVGEISENVIKHIEHEVTLLRHQGKQAWYCIMKGQDTARLLYAYHKLEERL